jgi:hypothetical protein
MPEIYCQTCKVILRDVYDGAHHILKRGCIVETRPKSLTGETLIQGRDYQYGVAR